MILTLAHLSRVMTIVQPFGIPSAFGELKTFGETKQVTEASFGLVILIGAWIFFITARPFRHKEPSLKPESSLAHEGSGLKADTDTWNCDLPLDRSAPDKADRWILG